MKLLLFSLLLVNVLGTIHPDKPADPNILLQIELSSSKLSYAIQSQILELSVNISFVQNELDNTIADARQIIEDGISQLRQILNDAEKGDENLKSCTEVVKASLPNLDTSGFSGCKQIFNATALHDKLKQIANEYTEFEKQTRTCQEAANVDTCVSLYIQTQIRIVKLETEITTNMLKYKELTEECTERNLMKLEKDVDSLAHLLQSCYFDSDSSE